MTRALHAVPAEQMVRSDEVSYRPSGAPASRARSSGSAKASPTIATTCARTAPIVARSSRASNDRPASVATCPPEVSVGSEAKVNPVLCMSGEAGMETRRWPLRACSAA